MTTKTPTKPTSATEALEDALRIVTVNGDDFRQAFVDRIANLLHERERTPPAIDGLLCYANAIGTDQEEQAVTEALTALMAELSDADRAELHTLLVDRLRWNDLEDHSVRRRLWTLTEELARPGTRSLRSAEAN